MTYVITGTCANDNACKDICLEDAISHGTVEVDGVTYNQFFIDPAKCNECGVCECICPAGAVYIDIYLTPDEQRFKKANAAYFKRMATPNVRAAAGTKK